MLDGEHEVPGAAGVSSQRSVFMFLFVGVRFNPKKRRNKQSLIDERIMRRYIRS